jgi:hypothetical protein
LSILVLLGLGAAVLFGVSIRPVFSAPEPGFRGERRTQPFQQKLDFRGSANPSLSVPIDKRLALTYAGAEITTASGQQPLVGIRTTAGGAPGEFPLVMTLQARAPGTDVYVASQSLAGVFADGGSDVTVSARTAEGKSFSGAVSLTGFLEDR